jgi:hypothetical protein
MNWVPPINDRDIDASRSRGDQGPKRLRDIDAVPSRPRGQNDDVSPPKPRVVTPTAINNQNVRITRVIVGRHDVEGVLDAVGLRRRCVTNAHSLAIGVEEKNVMADLS